MSTWFSQITMIIHLRVRGAQSTLLKEKNVSLHTLQYMLIEYMLLLREKIHGPLQTIVLNPTKSFKLF
jgi:hypothetical protein